MKIREIQQNEDVNRSLEIIRNSFRTVAEDMGLTPDNCPSHPSFLTLEKLEEARNRGLRFFGLFEAEKQVGFVAVEDAGDGVYYMERLAVLPEYRHEGCGLQLVRHVLEFVKGKGGKKVSIGIIYEQTVLKNWYKEIGFRETGTKTFEHLPFTVGFMDIDISV